MQMEMPTSLHSTECQRFWQSRLQLKCMQEKEVGNTNTDTLTKALSCLSGRTPFSLSLLASPIGLKPNADSKDIEQQLLKIFHHLMVTPASSEPPSPSSSSHQKNGYAYESIFEVSQSFTFILSVHSHSAELLLLHSA